MSTDKIKKQQKFRSRKYYDIHNQKVSGIYKIISKIDGKYYIGCSKNVIGYKGRWYNHKRKLNKNIHKNLHLQRAWTKYGEENFDFVLVEHTDPKDLLIVEQKYLNIAKTEKEKCYNVLFVSGGGNMGKEIYRIRSQKFCGKNHHRYGQHHTKESKNKMRQAKIGLYNGPNHPLYGKPVSQETRKKKSISMTGKFLGKNNPNFDHIIYNFQNTSTKETFNGTKFEFCKKIGVKNLWDIMSGKTKTVYGWTIKRALEPCPEPPRIDYRRL